MKISILTFSKEDNNGANLQCYALVQTLKKAGHEVDILDIQLPPVDFGLINKIIHWPQHLNFVRFRKKYLNCFTQSFHDVEDLKTNLPDRDLYIVGSDQVWNPDITKRLNPLIYFFSFLPDDKRRISYAASFGVSKWIWNTHTEDIARLLAKFESISVREMSGIDICQETFDLKATVVCDPTFLLSSYDDICGSFDENKLTREMIYFKFKRSAEAENYLFGKAREKSMPLVKLGDFHPMCGAIFRPFYTIKDWLNNIRYARFVITDSFHCMAFSILFNKPFIAMPSSNDRSGRMTSLLERLGLQERFCHDTQELKKRFDTLYETPIRYAEVNNKIADMRKFGQDFLLKRVSIAFNG